MALLVRPLIGALHAESRNHVHVYLLKLRHWLATEHPYLESPELWTWEFVGEHMAMVDWMREGEIPAAISSFNSSC